MNWDDPEGDVGENEDRESIVDGDELLDVEPEDRASAPEGTYTRCSPPPQKCCAYNVFRSLPLQLKGTKLQNPQ